MGYRKEVRAVSTGAWAGGPTRPLRLIGEVVDGPKAMIGRRIEFEVEPKYLELVVAARKAAQAKRLRSAKP